MAQIKGEHYDVLVCSAAKGAKWMANKDPEGDRAHINELINTLNKVTTDLFILISTVDVYPCPREVDEDSDPHGPNHAYGVNRLFLEDFVRNSFKKHAIIRLPALFGDGLKKNAIYDLLHDNQIDLINPNSQFQFYDLTHLWSDINVVIKNDIPLMNFATQPVQMLTVVNNFFPNKKIGIAAKNPVFYDVRTKYSEIFGKTGNYIYAESEIINGLGLFINKSSL
ncbi:MAG: NAD-dependent epimerase/dehydratase family protein [Minisyncoccia bacterium]